MSLGFGFMNGGRGSSEQENAQFQVYSTGIFSGEGVVPSSNLTVSLTGSGSAPQVFVGANPSGYKYTLDESEIQSFAITPPTSNSRVAAIVAAASGTAVTGDTPEARNPDECEWFVVYGAAAATPTAPDDATIRAAITAQTTKGLNGATAIVAVICNVVVDSSTTTITAPMVTNIAANISLGAKSVKAENIDFGTMNNNVFSTSTSVSVSGTETVVASFDLPSTGVYLVNVSAEFNGNGSSEWRDFNFRLYQGSTNRSASTKSIGGGAFIQDSPTIIAMINSANGTACTFRAIRNTGSVAASIGYVKGSRVRVG